MTKVVSTRISETEHKKFLNKCNDVGCNSADLLRDIVLEFLNEELDTPKIDNSDKPPATLEVNFSGQKENKPIPKAKVVWIDG